MPWHNMAKEKWGKIHLATRPKSGGLHGTAYMCKIKSIDAKFRYK